MKQYIRKNLNVKRLLEMGDLDIRRIAADNRSITADEYFSKVEDFIDEEPRIRAGLASVSKLNENLRALKELESKLGVPERTVNVTGNTEHLKNLERTKEVLTGIGYNKLNSDIDSIHGAIRIDDLRLAERLAGEVFSEFNKLADRVVSTYSVKKFATVQEDSNNILLSEALEYYDYIEANRKLRVLAVDDVAVVLNTIMSVLSPYYEVLALKNSLQIEKFLTHTTPELFLLDIEMSGANGFELVPLIRKFEEHKDTPIIFLTGNASRKNLKDAIDLGACDFITKPVDRDILLEKIEKNIVRKKAY